MPKKKRNPLTRLMYYFWTLFLTGLFVILPITITIALFTLTFRLIIGWLDPLKTFTQFTFLQAIPYPEVILAIIIIFLAGTVYNIFILRTIIHAIEDLLIKIPLIRPVYSGIKKLVQALSIQDKMTFKKVVFVEFPRPGIFSLGFLTSELRPEIAPDQKTQIRKCFYSNNAKPNKRLFCYITRESGHTY